MKNLLLVLAIAFVGFVDAQSDDFPSLAEEKLLKPIIVDYVKTPKGTATLMCIIGYVFLQDEEGNLTQLMREGDGVVAYRFMQPMSCSAYLKRKTLLKE